MSQGRPALAVTGFGLRITPLAGTTLRFVADELLARDPAAVAAELADVAQVERDANAGACWIETAIYRLPLPASWTLHVTSAPLFELLGPDGASISVRSARRMPSIESFQGPGHVFRDIGQLERAGWMEFEEVDGLRTLLHRHEQFHRGLTPFIVTLKVELDRAPACMPALVHVVERLEL